MRLAYDLHLHSCLSPCGDAESTPASIAGMCMLAGLGLVALTDHNSCAHARLFGHHAARYGLVALPGMELCTREEVHVVCLFDDIDAAEAFSAYVYDRLPPVQNRPEIFGEQTVCDERDEPVGTEPRLLITAADIGIYDVCALMTQYGGFAFPAHIDRPSFSLLANLGLWDDAMGFAVAERTAGADPAALPDVAYLINSDAHRLADIPDAEHYLEIEEATAGAALRALRRLGA